MGKTAKLKTKRKSPPDLPYNPTKLEQLNRSTPAPPAAPLPRVSTSTNLSLQSADLMKIRNQRQIPWQLTIIPAS